MKFSFQCCCFAIGLVALMGSTAEARAFYPSPEICTLLHRKCGPCQCGRRACRVVEECKLCYFGIPFDFKDRKGNLDVTDRAFDPCEPPTRRKRTETECCPFECENGGKRIPLKGKRSIQSMYPLCEFPSPRCSCPPHFTGQCCQTQIIETCKTKKCPPGTVCKEDRTSCLKPSSSCQPNVKCVPTGVCPMKCPPGTECKLSPPPLPDCPPSGNCPSIALKWTWQCVPITPHPCSKCPPNTICKKQSVVCAKFPCLPPAVVCIPKDPCHLKFCQPGTVCQVQKAQAVCVLEKPVSCPEAPTGLFTTCDVKCHGDDSCRNDEKCCSYGCSRICLKPQFQRLGPQF